MGLIDERLNTGAKNSPISIISYLCKRKKEINIAAIE